MEIPESASSVSINPLTGSFEEPVDLGGHDEIVFVQTLIFFVCIATVT